MLSSSVARAIAPNITRRAEEHDDHPEDGVARPRERTIPAGYAAKVTDRPELAGLLGALVIAFSAILVRLADVTPVTAAFFRCAYAAARARAAGTDGESPARPARAS